MTKMRYHKHFSIFAEHINCVIVNGEIIRKHLALYGVAILVLLIALNQMLLRQDGLSSWKGGGMGMYADYHPVYNKVLLKSADPTSKQNPQPDKKTTDLISEFRLFPTTNRFRKLQSRYKYLYGIEQLEMQIWSPVFDPDQGTFELRLKKEY